MFVVNLIVVVGRADMITAMRMSYNIVETISFRFQIWNFSANHIQNSAKKKN